MKEGTPLPEVLLSWTMTLAINPKIETAVSEQFDTPLAQVLIDSHQEQINKNQETESRLNHLHNSVSKLAYQLNVKSADIDLGKASKKPSSSVEKKGNDDKNSITSRIRQAVNGLCQSPQT